nr:MAG TPA: hypothetical protein [Caudoviricetes sp.]
MQAPITVADRGLTILAIRCDSRKSTAHNRKRRLISVSAVSVVVIAAMRS